MNNKLSRYIEKKKIDIANLTVEEQATFEQWEKTLSDEPVTVESLTEWLEFRKSAVGDSLGSLENSPRKQDKLIIWQALLTQMIKLIKAPKAEREALEIHLQSMLDEKEGDKL